MIKYVVTNKEDGGIEGYQNINVDTFNRITNGTAAEIILDDIDNQIFTDKIALIATAFKKLENTGLLTIKFHNFTKISKELLKGNLNSQALSNIVEKSKSCISESDIMELVSRADGIRPFKAYNDNLYSIVVLQKQL